MDPVVSFIIGMLIAGLNEFSSKAAQDAYNALKSLIIKRFKSRGKPEGEEAVEKFEKEPKAWQTTLEDYLNEIQVQDDSEIIEAAQELAKVATYSLELDFRQPEPNFPAPPDAQIYIKTYSTDNGRHFITPHCITYEEINYQIRRLEDELKAIRQKAKNKFKSKSFR
jgi:hypothetical protein